MDRVAEMNDDEELENNSENQSSLANSAAHSASTHSLDTSEPGATVYLRMRPINESTTAYRIESNSLMVGASESASTEKQYEFSRVFPGHTSQREIYEKCVQSYIENDESFTLMAYGTSSSGKTHTINGTESSAGIIPRAIVHLFTRFQDVISDVPGVKLEKGNIMLVDESNYAKEEQLRAKYLRDAQKMRTFTKVFEKVYEEHDFETIPRQRESVMIWISFAEIYNENVHDLLAPVENGNANKPRKNLKIISNDGNAFIKDLTSVNVRSAAEAYSVYLSGLEQANTASTNVNNNSSRSHCIFLINVINCTSAADFNLSVYKFCDLAGSERQKKTENMGTRMKEAQRINSSLLVLGRCLDILHANQQKKGKEVIPFRETKLTLFLQKGLTGREKITMIVNMLPKLEFLEENLTVLQFASIAQKIVFKPPKQAAPSRRRSTRFSWFMSTYQSSMRKNSSDEDLLNLREENEQLATEKELLIAEIEKLQKELTNTRAELLNDFLKQKQDNEKIFNGRIQYLQEQLDLQKRKVSCDCSCTHSFTISSFLISFVQQNGDLVAENKSLWDRLNDRADESSIIEIDDDVDGEDSSSEMN